MTRLLAFLCLLVVGFFVLHRWAPIRHHYLAGEEVIVGFIGFLFLLIVLFMLSGTKRWDSRALGFAAALAGIAIYLLDTLWIALDRQHHLPLHPLPTPIITDLILDTWLIGGLFVLWAMLHDGHAAWRHWRARRKAARQ